MAKTKDSKKSSDRTASAAHTKKDLGKAVDGRTAKPTEASSASANAKEMAAKVKETANKAAKKVQKAPTPEDSDDSEVSSEDSNSDSDAEFESEDEAVAAASERPKVNGESKPNGVKPAPAVEADEESGSEQDSDSDSDSTGSDSNDEDDEEDDDDTVGVPKAVGLAAKAAMPAAEQESSRGTFDDSDDSEDAGQAQAKPGQTLAADDEEEEDSNDSSGTSEDGSSDDDEDDEEEKVEEPVPKKRKADVSETPSTKKARTDESASTDSKNLFVGQISWNVDDDWLQREFEQHGTVVRCRIMMQDGKSRGFGYVEFSTSEEAAAALEAMNGAFVDNRPIRVNYADSRPQNSTTPNRAERVNSRAEKHGDAPSAPSDVLWVGNISFSADTDELRTTFEEYGDVLRLTLPTDKETGAMKGFGYVGFGSVDQAKAAYEALNGASIAGRNIRIDFAGPRPEREGGGFRGGRGGGDRGGRGGRGDFRGGRGGRGDFRGGRGDWRGGRGGSRGSSFTKNRGGFGDFSGTKISFD